MGKNDKKLRVWPSFERKIEVFEGLRRVGKVFFLKFVDFRLFEMKIQLLGEEEGLNFNFEGILKWNYEFNCQENFLNSRIQFSFEFLRI